LCPGGGCEISANQWQKGAEGGRGEAKQTQIDDTRSVLSVIDTCKNASLHVARTRCAEMTLNLVD